MKIEKTAEFSKNNKSKQWSKINYEGLFQLNITPKLGL